MINNLTIKGLESRGSIRHKSLALKCSNLRTQVSLIGVAKDAIPLQALRSVTWYNQVTWFVVSDIFSYTFDNSCSFVAQNARKFAFRIASIQRVNISVAQRISNNFDSYLSTLRRRYKNFDCLEWFIRLKSDRGFALDDLTNCSAFSLHLWFLLIS